MTLAETLKDIERNNEELYSIINYAELIYKGLKEKHKHTINELKYISEQIQEIYDAIQRDGLSSNENHVKLDRLLPALDVGVEILESLLTQDLDESPDFLYNVKSVDNYIVFPGYFGDHNHFNLYVNIVGTEELSDQIWRLEKEKRNLIIKAVNEYLTLVMPGQELNGAYWTDIINDSDSDWSRINGIEYFLGTNESSFEEDFGITTVKHDLKSEEQPFTEESQNIALVSIKNYKNYLRAENNLWGKIRKTLVIDGIVISNHLMMGEHSECFERIEEPIINEESERFWVSNQTSYDAYTPGEDRWVSEDKQESNYVTHKFSVYKRIR